MELAKLANGKDPTLSIGRSPSRAAQGQKDTARLPSEKTTPRKAR